MEDLAPGASRTVPIMLLALAGGLRSVSGFRIVDVLTGHAVDVEHLTEVFVLSGALRSQPQIAPLLEL